MLERLLLALVEGLASAVPLWFGAVIVAVSLAILVGLQAWQRGFRLRSPLYRHTPSDPVNELLLRAASDGRVLTFETSGAARHAGQLLHADMSRLQNWRVHVRASLVGVYCAGITDPSTPSVMLAFEVDNHLFADIHVDGLFEGRGTVAGLTLPPIEKPIPEGLVYAAAERTFNVRLEVQSTEIRERLVSSAGLPLTWMITGMWKIRVGDESALIYFDTSRQDIPDLPSV